MGIPPLDEISVGLFIKLRGSAAVRLQTFDKTDDKKKQLADNYFIKIGQSCLAQIQCLLCYTIFNTYIPGKIDRHIQNCYEFLPIDQQKDLKIIEELENNHFIRD